MSSITSTGLGSGLDINSIVTAIVGAEKEPALAKMLRTSGQATAMISAYGMLNSELSGFKDSYKDLGRSSTFSAATASSSDSGILDTKLGIGAATGSWDFEVQQRAKAQTIVTSSANSYSEASSEIGTGEISFRYGTYNSGSFSVNPDKAIETLTIDSSNNSLDKMRDAINEGAYSVSASIINDGTNYRLVLTNKETGEANAMEMTVLDNDGDNNDTAGLSAFTFSATTKHLDETSTAQDAKIIMNGIEITRSTNEITSVIEGVTLKINGETAIGKTVNLTINQDTSAVEEQLNAFVENYNSTITRMNSLTADGGEGGSDGALNGDSTVRNIQNQMRSVLNTTLTHIGGAVQSFADLGMLTNRDGTLSLDATKLSDAMENDMQSIANFFTASGAANDSSIIFESNSSLTKPGSYDVEITKIATQGALTGSAFNFPSFPANVVDGANTFTMRLDGILSEDITLTAGSYDSIDSLIIELQSKINSDKNFVEKEVGVNINSSGGAFQITSKTYGSTSLLAIFPGTLDANFGLSGPTTSIFGENAEGKIDGKVAYGDGQYLLSESGDSTGIKIKIDDGVLGSRGQVTYAEGMSAVMNRMLTGIIDGNISSTKGDVASSGSIIDGKIDSLNKKINQIDVNQENLLYKMDKLEMRLYKQFNAMDMAVSSLNNTMSYLKATLDALPGYTRDK